MKTVKELESMIQQLKYRLSMYIEKCTMYENSNRDFIERINKAIEYIEENEYVDYNPTLDGSEDDSYMKLPRSLNLFNEGLDILLDILKGVDKE